MTIALDASTPALAWGTSPVTSASFTPPNDSLLVAVVTADWFGSTPTITCTSTGLTFTERASYGTDSQGIVKIYTAPVGSNGGSARTVQTTTSIAANTLGLKVFVLTGADTASPVDSQTGATGSTADPYSPTLTVNSDGCFVCGGAVDWNGTGAPTSTDSYQSNSTNGTLSGIATWKASLVNAGTATFNFNSVSTPMWSWAGISIKAAGGGGGQQTTGALYASGTPTTGQSNGSWATPTNATGAPDAARAVWTSTGSGATGWIIPAAFGAQAAIGSAPASVDQVSVTVYAYTSNTTRMASIAVQLTDNGTLFGSPQTMTKSTSTTFSQTFTFTGVTWAQLANLGVRVLYTRGAVTTSATGSVDAVSIDVTYTPVSTTPVSTSRATTWNTAATVTPSRATTWNTRAGVGPVTRATTWNVWTAVAPTSRATTWRVLAQASTSRATTWRVLAAVLASRATTWNVGWGVPVSTSRATTWRTLATATATRASTWSTAASVAAQRATGWKVLTSALASRSTSWGVATSVLATRGTGWAVRAVAGPTARSTTWATRAAVSTSRATLWAVLVDAGHVQTSRASTWSVYGSVGPVTRATTWTVRTPVTQTRATSWRTLALVTASRASTWGVGGRVTATRSTLWSVYGSVIPAVRATTWNVRTSVTQTRGTSWRTLALVPATRSTGWAVLARVAASRATTWETREQVLTARWTLWAVAAVAWGPGRERLRLGGLARDDFVALIHEHVSAATSRDAHAGQLHRGTSAGLERGGTHG